MKADFSFTKTLISWLYLTYNNTKYVWAKWIKESMAGPHRPLV